MPDPIESTTGNIYVDYNSLSEPAVVDGMFTIARGNIGEGLNIYLEHDEELNLRAHYSGDTDEGNYRFSFSGSALDPLETREEHFGLVTVFDDNPHFEMTYNVHPSQLLRLEEGFYLTKDEPNLISHYPIALSLICDEGMSKWDARRLFDHTVKPDMILEDGRTITLYCPREVAHVLVSDPQTGANKYYAMTKQDFDRTYGDLDTFASGLLSE